MTATVAESSRCQASGVASRESMVIVKFSCKRKWKRVRSGTRLRTVIVFDPAVSSGRDNLEDKL